MKTYKPGDLDPYTGYAYIPAVPGKGQCYCRVVFRMKIGEAYYWGEPHSLEDCPKCATVGVWPIPWSEITEKEEI